MQLKHTLTILYPNTQFPAGEAGNVHREPVHQCLPGEAENERHRLYYNAGLKDIFIERRWIAFLNQYGLN